MQTSFEFPFIAALAPQYCALHETLRRFAWSVHSDCCSKSLEANDPAPPVVRAGGFHSSAAQCHTARLEAYDVDAAVDAKSA